MNKGLKCFWSTWQKCTYKTVKELDGPKAAPLKKKITKEVRSCGKKFAKYSESSGDHLFLVGLHGGDASELSSKQLVQVEK